MFYHVVLMSFRPECGADFFAKADWYAKRIVAECDGVTSYVMALNLAARSDGLTHGIIGAFASSEAHDAYQISAVHQEMKAFMATGLTRIVVLDVDNAGPGASR